MRTSSALTPPGHSFRPIQGNWRAHCGWRSTPTHACATATVPFFAEHVVKPVFQGKPADAAALTLAAPARDECFDYLERELVGREFATGDAVSVADIAIGAQLITYQQGAGAIDSSRWPQLTHYLAALSARPSWEPILAEESQTLAAARERKRLAN